ncbi:MAG: DUF3379 family protein [Burkholderiales bacterium]
MNCLEFRREKLADPRRLSPEAQAHAARCPACAAFAREVDQTERELDRALLTPMPEGLADRILLRTRGGQPSRRRWAIAAGVVLASALGFKYFKDSAKPSDQYARLAIEHVVMEPESLTAVRNANPEALQAVLQNFGGSLKEPLGNVRYIRLCPVEEGFGWHLVFETPEGLATLILVPGKQLRGLETASSGGWSALVRPARGGYYAIVTASVASTWRFDLLLQEHVDWARS